MADKRIQQALDAFFNEDSEIDKNHRKKALIFTGLFFAGLFVIFFFAALKAPQEDKGFKGIEVQLGAQDAGMEDALDDQTTEPEVAEEEQDIEEEQDADDQAEQEEIAEPEETEADDHTVDSEEPDPVEDQTPEDDQEVAEDVDEQEEEQEEQEQVDSLALYQGPSRQQQGQQESAEETGDPEGADDTDSPEDIGQAAEDEGGLSYELGGRRMARAPEIDDETQKTGTVVVQITVDRSGEVVHARPGARGSTTNDPELLEIARQSAFDTEFEPDADAPEEHRGTMEFTFRLE